MATGFSKDHGLSVGGTVLLAAMAVPGESFTLRAITSVGSFTLEGSCARYFSSQTFSGIFIEEYTFPQVSKTFKKKGLFLDVVMTLFL